MYCWFLEKPLLRSQVGIKLEDNPAADLGRAGELGDSLGSFRNGVLGKLSRKKKSDGGLHLSGGESGLLVVASELGSLKSDAVEDIVHEGVEDGDTSLRDTSLRVNLLQDLVDVGGV